MIARSPLLSFHTLKSGVIALAALLILHPALAASSAPPSIKVVVSADAPELIASPEGESVSVAGFGQLLIPGKPALPSRIFAIAIPPGAELLEVTHETGAAVELPGAHRIAPAALPRVIGAEDPSIRARELETYRKNYRAVYESDAVYPALPVEFVRTAGYREYNLVDVRVTPYAYHPESGRLEYYPEIEVCVHYRAPDRAAGSIVLSRSEAVAASARDFIINYAQAQAWYAKSDQTDRGENDFVIITLPSLTNAVAPLVDWESQKGRGVAVVTTSWIDANYSGYDLAEKMRNFLHEKYPAGEWGIEDVLLVGDYDDVPMRRTAQDIGYGRPETDYYYAELSMPDSASWDADGDQEYGENSDPVDFYTEVNVGRIPYSVASTVTHICEKSVAYEQNNDPAFKKNMLLLGAYFWADTDTAVLMEAKIDQPWMSDWTFTRMYEQNSTVYSTYPCDMALTRTNAISTWSSGSYAFVNWAGHGSQTSCHIMGYGSASFVQSSDCSSLNDDYPSIVFADACSNSDTDAANIGRAMLNRGAVGFVGATKVALGRGAWSHPNHGSSQSMDYYFTTYVTSGDYTQGQAHQAALRYMYTHGLWSYTRYEMFEWGALWGNPALSMAAPPNLTMRFPNGLPEVLTPEESTEIPIEVLEFEEGYVPGSGLLYYRYDGENILPVPFVPQGGGLYTATLPPATCSDTPEFFFVLEGDQGTVLKSPANAPTDMHSADVGVFMVVVDQPCETTAGWTVGAPDDDATTGIWDRGDPEGTLAQPEDDHTTAGTECWVTDSRAGGMFGDWDVDDGKTTLYTPVYDLSDAAAPVISYWRWYSNNTGGAAHRDRFYVDISNDGGATWVNAETVGPSGAETVGGWFYHEFNVSAFYDSPDAVQVRFVASDGGEPSVVEAAIDDFRIQDLSCDDAACAGDLDGNGSVELADLQTLLSNYGAMGGMACADGDMDGDGNINLGDLQALLAVYGTNP